MGTHLGSQFMKTVRIQEMKPIYLFYLYFNRERERGFWCEQNCEALSQKSPAALQPPHGGHLNTKQTKK